MMEILEKMHDYLLDMNIATEEEINLVIDINGYSEETFKDILYARIGYRDFDQLESDFYNESEDEDYEL